MSRTNNSQILSLSMIHQSKQNMSICEEEFNQRKIDQTIDEFIDFSNEDHPSEIEIHPSYNDLFRGKFPDFFKSETYKYETPLQYVESMYEILRESNFHFSRSNYFGDDHQSHFYQCQLGFMQPIKQVFSKIKNSQSIEEFKENLKNEQKSNKVFQIYDITTIELDLGFNGLFAKFQVEQNNQYEYYTDSKEFEDLKRQSLIILVNQKTGALIFGTVLRYKQEEEEQITTERNLDKEQEDDEEEFKEDEEQFRQTEYDPVEEENEQIEAEFEKEFTRDKINHSTLSAASQVQQNKLKKFRVQIKIMMNSNNYLDVIQQFNTDEKQFIMLEATHYYLPLYYNLKVLYYMKSKGENLQFPFEDQVLRGNPPAAIANPEDSLPEYKQFNSKPQSRINRNAAINQLVQLSDDCDEFQKSSLSQMLKNKIHFVEGPPGTGKTFMAVKAVLKLLQTYSTVGQDYKPIIILCKKNVSLDSFLRTLIEQNERSILRVGSPSDELLKQFTLKKKLKEASKLQQRIPFKRCNFQKVFFKDKIQKQTSRDIVQLFLDHEVDLPEIVFMAEYFPNRNIEYSDSLQEMKFQLFRGWHKNNLTCDILVQTMETEQQFFKQIKKYVNSQLKNKFTELCDSLNNKQNNFRQQIKELFSKKLIDINIDNPHKRFKIRNLRLENHTQLFQTFIQSLNSISSLQEFNGQLRYDILFFSLYHLKIERLKEYYQEYQTNLNADKKQLIRQQELQIRSIMQSHKIIGMTTTGYTMRFKFIQMIEPEIIIVEEASEIDEWNSATFFQPFIKHIIQIGDYLQLKPIQTNKNFFHKQLAELSQFERVLTKLKIKSSSKLKVQRRMITSLANFPRIVYGIDNYLDSEDSQIMLHEEIPIDNSILFINHTFPEQQSVNSPSFYNKFEAIVALRIFQELRNTYKIPSSSITILCMYGSQKKFIDNYCTENKIQTQEDDYKDDFALQISTVDEFQGKENDYIILSMVRCNPDDHIGFIVERNRINVAFSRAKRGLIALGAFWMYEQKLTLWKHIMKEATNNGYFINDLDSLKESYFPYLDLESLKAETGLENEVCVRNRNHIPHIFTEECGDSESILQNQILNFNQINQSNEQNQSDQNQKSNQESSDEERDVIDNWRNQETPNPVSPEIQNKQNQQGSYGKRKYERKQLVNKVNQSFHLEHKENVVNNLLSVIKDEAEKEDINLSLTPSNNQILSIEMMNKEDPLQNKEDSLKSSNSSVTYPELTIRKGQNKNVNNGKENDSKLYDATPAEDEESKNHKIIQVGIDSLNELTPPQEVQEKNDLKVDNNQHNLEEQNIIENPQDGLYAEKQTNKLEKSNKEQQEDIKQPSGNNSMLSDDSDSNIKECLNTSSESENENDDSQLQTGKEDQQLNNTIDEPLNQTRKESPSVLDESYQIIKKGNNSYLQEYSQSSSNTSISNSSQSDMTISNVLDNTLQFENIQFLPVQQPEDNKKGEEKYKSIKEILVQIINSKYSREEVIQKFKLFENELTEMISSINNEFIKATLSKSFDFTFQKIIENLNKDYAGFLKQQDSILANVDWKNLHNLGYFSTDILVTQLELLKTEYQINIEKVNFPVEEGTENINELFSIFESQILFNSPLVLQKLKQLKYHLPSILNQADIIPRVILSYFDDQNQNEQIHFIGEIIGRLNKIKVQIKYKKANNIDSVSIDYNFAQEKNEQNSLQFAKLSQLNNRLQQSCQAMYNPEIILLIRKENNAFSFKTVEINKELVIGSSQVFIFCRQKQQNKRQQQNIQQQQIHINEFKISIFNSVYVVMNIVVD